MLELAGSLYQCQKHVPLIVQKGKAQTYNKNIKQIKLNKTKIKKRASTGYHVKHVSKTIVG